MINATRDQRFWLGATLIILLSGSWIYELQTKGFHKVDSIAHLVGVLLALTLIDRDIALKFLDILLRRGVAKK